MSEHLATLWELRTVYTLEELYQLWELAITDRFNEWSVSRQAAERSGRARR